MREIVLLQSAQADILEIYTRHGEKSYHLMDAALESIRKQPEHALRITITFAGNPSRELRSGFFIPSSDRVSSSHSSWIFVKIPT